MSLFVIDASVAVKWVIDEGDTQAALALRHHSLIAPDLLTAECANILWKKAQRDEVTPEEAGFAARLLALADIELRPMRSFLEAATALAIELDHPAYDCIYLAIAEHENRPLVTADDRFLRKLSQHQSGKFADRVIRLGEFGSGV